MERKFQVNYKKDILRFALLLGEQMLTNGAETSRVEDSVLRVCKSRGFKHVNVFTTPTCVIISDEKFDGLTFMKTISKRTINLTKIDRLNEQGRRLALQMLDDLLSNKKNRKDYESPRQKFLRETDEVLALVNRESGTTTDKKVLPLFKKKVPAI